MTTIQRIGRMRKLSRSEIAETPGLDAGVVRADYSARNTAFDDRYEYDLLRLEWIRPSPRNPRKHFDDADLQELAASIRQVGLLEPVVVRPSADSSSAAPRFELIAGERRWRSARIANLTDLPAIIRRDVDDALQVRLALLENLQRKDLDPLEEADGYRQLQELGMKQTAIGEAIGRSQEYIANRTRLLKLPEPIQQRIGAGELSPSHGLGLLKYDDFPAVQAKLADMVVAEKVPSKELDGDFPPLHYQLEQAGVVRDLSTYRANFDTAVCKDCPFGARRASKHGDGICLKPEHYDELQAEADRKRQVEVQRQIEKAKVSGKQLPNLSKLDYRSYDQIGHKPPEGCSEACACRGAAISYGDEVVQICTDPKRFRGLKAAETKIANADKRVELKGVLDRLNDKLDLLEEIGEREIAILVTAAIVNCNAPDLREAVKWVGGLVDAKDLENYGTRKDRPKTLAVLAARDLVKMGVYAILHHEIRNALSGSYGQQDKPWADWYLAGQPPRPKGRPLVEAFHRTSGDQPQPELGQENGCQRECCGHSQAKHYDGNGGRGHESTGCKRGCGCTEFLAAAAAQREPDYAAAGHA